MDLEEALDLVDDAVEVAGLVAIGAGVGVAVHRVGLPDDLVPGGLHGLHDRWQDVADLVVAHAGDQRQAARIVVRVEAVDVLDGLLWGGRRPDLHADRVADQGGEVDVGVVQPAGALADPHLVGGEVVEHVLALFVVGQAQHATLVVQDEGLVGGVDVRGVQGGGGHATGAHELQAAVDLLGQGLVAGACRGVGDEFAVPLVQLVQVRGARAGQRADEVHGRRGVRVGAHHAGRVVGAGFLGGLVAVDEVAAVVQQAVGVAVGGARLCVLTSDAGHLHHGGRRPVGQDDRHLQEGLDVAADVRFGVGLEGLGAVTALQQEGLAQGDVGELLAQAADLRGDDDRRDGLENPPDTISMILVPARLLLGITSKNLVKLRCDIVRQRWEVGHLIDGEVNSPRHA